MAYFPKSVELADRVSMHFVEQGGPAGVPVLFLHGVTDSWHSFEPVLPHLGNSIHAFAISQRGHGDSGRPAEGYRTRDFAADIAAFVHTLKLGPCIVVGHSMGSTHALRFAIDYPELTRGLVLVGTFASYSKNAGVVDLWQNCVSKLQDPIDPAFVREFQQSTLATPVSPRFLDLVVSESLKMPARVWRAVFAGFLEDDFSHELNRVAAPTLILWGDRDEFCPRSDQDILTRAIAGSHLVIYPGVGHALHWEQPERFAADVARFCATLASGPAARKRLAG